LSAGGGDLTLVVPTIGRPSLAALLDSLAASRGPLPDRIVLVADGVPVAPVVPAALGGRVTVVRGDGAGPAAARNAGWRRASTRWVAFLDDDVVVPDDWLERLDEDLAAAEPDVGGVQGRIRVPLPAERPPTDWERNVSGLEDAQWATADMVYRRDALAAVGGFDERFPRAYREDADLGLRVTAAGWRIVCGRRHVLHPVRPAGPLVSLRLQAGNADDPLMRVLHGRAWRERAGVPRGRRPRHLATVLAGLIGLTGWARGRRRLAALGAAGWLAGTAEFAWARIAPGPRDARELVRMLLTSALIPPAATYHWLAGWARVPARLGRR
jgi:hypothetical protein